MTNYTYRIVSAIIALAVIIAIGLALGAAWQRHADSQADWTVMPCSAWAHTEYPKVPEYTIPNICLAPDGSLIRASADPDSFN